MWMVHKIQIYYIIFKVFSTQSNLLLEGNFRYVETQRRVLLQKKKLTLFYPLRIFLPVDKLKHPSETLSRKMLSRGRKADRREITKRCQNDYCKRHERPTWQCPDHRYIRIVSLRPA
jgi:predicted nucleic acid binding AN1-type Zn finger protein